ncbi:MAG: 30S ribosomal protein S27ae [Nanoarchaeota archaeon]|nr:30S ribosomal protein S27ae [Nanoarchaeota archaeon]
MAKKKGGKGGAGKDKKAKSKKKHQSLAQVYKVEGGSIKRKNKSCPKCGPGTFMADHKNRWSCGKCNYMEKK